jgi:hypothetical protein
LTAVIHVSSAYSDILRAAPALPLLDEVLCGPSGLPRRLQASAVCTVLKCYVPRTHTPNREVFFNPVSRGGLLGSFGFGPHTSDEKGHQGETVVLSWMEGLLRHMLACFIHSSPPHTARIPPTEPASSSRSTRTSRQVLIPTMPAGMGTGHWALGMGHGALGKGQRAKGKELSISTGPAGRAATTTPSFLICLISRTTAARRACRQYSRLAMTNYGHGLAGQTGEASLL